MKKSLETKEKPKELTEQEKEFEEQRKATIEEVRKAKGGQSKTFGGAGGKVAPVMRGGGKENQYQGPHRSNSTDSGKSWSTNGTSKEDDSSRSGGGGHRSENNYRELSSYAGVSVNTLFLVHDM